ncbi:MAG: PIN domain-containing protein [Candidatus Aenigmarchaeota archaeon]|nr:PIN domain-containing protein [Candidatus Aenigmarchaeota archaeon]
MDLVVDTNVLFSFFNEKSKARELLTRPSFELYSPEFALDELNKHKNEITRKFSLSELQFSLILRLLETSINFIGIKYYEKFVPRGYELASDPDDTDFFAVALKLDCAIWSNDRDFKNQSKIEVYTTTELLTRINKIL